MPTAVRGGKKGDCKSSFIIEVGYKCLLNSALDISFLYQIRITPTHRELGFYPRWGNILQGKNYFGQDKKYEDVKASHYPMVAVVIYSADF